MCGCVSTRSAVTGLCLRCLLQLSGAAVCGAGCVCGMFAVMVCCRCCCGCCMVLVLYGSAAVCGCCCMVAVMVCCRCCCLLCLVVGCAYLCCVIVVVVVSTSILFALPVAFFLCWHVVGMWLACGVWLPSLCLPSLPACAVLLFVLFSEPFALRHC